MRMAPPTPPPATLLSMVLRSSEPPPAAAPPIMLWTSTPPRPPPTIPAMEFPAVPRLFSFIAAPAMLPPTAPLTASMIRLIMFMGFGFLSCSRLHSLNGPRTGPVKLSGLRFVDVPRSAEARSIHSRMTVHMESGHLRLRLSYALRPTIRPKSYSKRVTSRAQRCQVPNWKTESQTNEQRSISSNDRRAWRSHRVPGAKFCQLQPLPPAVSRRKRCESFQHRSPAHRNACPGSAWRL